MSGIGLSVIVVYELFCGAFKSQRQEHNLRRVELTGFPLVRLDWAAARAAGEIRAFVGPRGAADRTLRHPDRGAGAVAQLDPGHIKHKGV